VKFPREFNRYYSYIRTDIGYHLEPWQCARLKRLAFNAWMAGRRHEKKQRR